VVVGATVFLTSDDECMWADVAWHRRQTDRILPCLLSEVNGHIERDRTSTSIRSSQRHLDRAALPPYGDARWVRGPSRSRLK
jgi:hypothetical protein